MTDKRRLQHHPVHVLTPFSALKRAFWLTLLLPCFTAYGERDDPYAEINQGWDRFGSVYQRVIQNYYAPLDHEAIMRSAIEGMLSQLDDYSQYYDEEGLRQLRQDTTGKFAGLGITVGIMDKYPVVIAPIEGTPAARAGVQPGDLIVAIEGRDTFGLSLESIVNELRGDPGSPVRITLARRGGGANWDVVIVREVIKIRSVAVADEVTPGIGYISLRQTRFSEDTSAEVEIALEKLFARDITGLIIDLRGNPGGLLSQAAEVADLFLQRGAPIVSIRERLGGNEEVRVSQRRPPADRLPLVVLIDGGSASAAEIVAGAMQDNDRGLVVGTPSFGKGSVQTIFDLRDEDDAALKLTTALYYTPSGRSIHKEPSTGRNVVGTLVPIAGTQLPATQLLGVLLHAADATHAEQQLQARFGLEPDEARRVLTTPLGDLIGSTHDEAVDASDGTAEFETTHGRVVYGGGGITPDVTVEADVPPDWVLDLYRHRVFFDFIVEYHGQSTDGDVDDDMLNAFHEFARHSPAADARRDQAAAELDALRRLADRSAWDVSVLSRLDSLQAAIDRSADALGRTEEAAPYIRAALRRELAVRTNGTRASLLVDLDTDPQVTEAITLLRDPDRYEHLLHRANP